MAGLLDFPSIDTPQGQGLLSFALGLMQAGGPQPRPTSFGQSVASAGLNALNTVQDAQNHALKRKLVSAQIGDILAQAAQRESQRKAAEDLLKSRQGFLDQLATPTYGPGATVMRPETMVPQRRPLDPVAAIRAGFTPTEAEKLAESPNWGRPEVTRTIESADDQGNKVTRQFDRYGNPVGDSLPGYVPPVQVNQGDRISFTKPVPGASLPINLSPEQRDASARGWANVNLDRAKFNRGDWVNDLERGIQINSVTGESRPITSNGTPIGVKPTKMTGTMQERFAENSVTLQKIDQAIAEVQRRPESFGMKNYLGDPIRQRTDPEGVRGRALVADIAGQKIHDRSGAAVTVGEAERLKPYVPNPTDSAETVARKLQLFKAEYVAMQQALANGASIAQATRTQNMGGAGGSWDSPFLKDAIAEELKRRGAQ